MPQAYHCPTCQKEIQYQSQFCQHCGSKLDWQQQPPPPPPILTPAPDMQATTATAGTAAAGVQGTASPLPAELKGWNWGAFFLGWIWGIGNNTWIAFLGFIPMVNAVMPFILGAKGSEWAWQNRKWDSIDHFKSTQSTWKKWGIIFFIIGLAVSFLITIASAIIIYQLF